MGERPDEPMGLAPFAFLMLPLKTGATINDERIEALVQKLAECVGTEGEKIGATYVDAMCAALEFVARMGAAPAPRRRDGAGDQATDRESVVKIIDPLDEDAFHELNVAWLRELFRDFDRLLAANATLRAERDALKVRVEEARRDALEQSELVALRERDSHTWSDPFAGGAKEAANNIAAAIRALATPPTTKPRNEEG